MTFVLLVIWRHIFYECLDKITFLYVVPSVVLVHLVWWVQTSSDVSSSHSVCLQELCFCKRVKNTFNTFIIWGRSFGTLFRVSFPSGVRYRQNSPCHLSSHLLSPRRSTRHTRPCCRTCWRWPGRSPPCRAHTDRRKSQRPRWVARLCRAGLTWADGTRLRRQNKGVFRFFHLLPGFSFVYFPKLTSEHHRRQYDFILGYRWENQSPSSGLAGTKETFAFRPFCQTAFRTSGDV